MGFLGWDWAILAVAGRLWLGIDCPGLRWASLPEDGLPLLGQAALTGGGLAQVAMDFFGLGWTGSHGDRLLWLRMDCLGLEWAAMAQEGCHGRDWFPQLWMGYRSFGWAYLAREGLSAGDGLPWVGMGFPDCGWAAKTGLQPCCATFVVQQHRNLRRLRNVERKHSPGHHSIDCLKKSREKSGQMTTQRGWEQSVLSQSRSGCFEDSTRKTGRKHGVCMATGGDMIPSGDDIQT